MFIDRRWLLKIYFFCLLILVGCYENHVIIYVFKGSQIFVTSDKEDKLQLLNDCKNSKLYLYNDSIKIDAKCLFKDVVSANIISSSNVNSSYLDSAYTLFTQRYGLQKQGTFKLLKCSTLIHSDISETFDVVFIDDKRLVVVYDVFALEFISK